MREVLGYVTNRSGTVHLATQRSIATHERPSTLCGQRVRWSLWEEGDETVSGVAATCRTCRRVAGLP